MKTARFKQCFCIAENDAAAFQDKLNSVLAQAADPEVFLDQSRPFTAYVFYHVKKDMPETVLELLRMLDDEHGNAICADCPQFEKSPDKRRKWGKCKKKSEPVKCDAAACELFFLAQRKAQIKIAEEFDSIPYMIEGAPK